MGIGSFFASLFQKEPEDRTEIRELHVEKEQKERAGRKPVSGEQKPKPSTEGKTEIPPKTEQPEPSEEDKAKAARKEYNQARKELYQHLNRTMKVLYEADRAEGIESLAALDGPSDKLAGYLPRIMEDLPDNLKDLLNPFITEEFLARPAGLKEAFHAMMLPFYPAYKKEFDEFRYNTCLNRDALDLFRRLTGRKYRLGYRNNYSSGTAAFEWKKDRYKVYNKDGVLLCDGVFKDGAVWDGYAILAGEDVDDPNWKLVKKGFYKEGEFRETAAEYVYRKAVGLADR
ncbi:MAG: hypothetical protein IJ137_06685 [Eubacterium sp.]|nr:hypothetical protein [Eubacterium sp.]